MQRNQEMIGWIKDNRATLRLYLLAAVVSGTVVLLLTDGSIWWDAALVAGIFAMLSVCEQKDVVAILPFALGATSMAVIIVVTAGVIGALGLVATDNPASDLAPIIVIALMMVGGCVLVMVSDGIRT